jgi:regulator of sigma E protease
LAGVFFNFLLAIVVFAIVYSFSGIPTKTDKVKILEVLPNSPALQSGLKADDTVLKVGDKTLRGSQAFIELIEEGKGQQLVLTIEREKDNPCETQVFGGMIEKENQPAFSCQEGKLLLWVVPRENPPEQEGPLGVIISDMEMKKYSAWQMPFRGIVEGIKEALAWLILIVKALEKMLFDLFARGIIPKDVAGPVGIFQITGLVAQTGFLNVLQFIGILSINLAVINLLPLPALDGGRLLYIFIYEGLFRRKSTPTIERLVNSIGIVFLLCLIILITFNDIKRLVGWEKINQWLAKIWPF